MSSNVWSCLLLAVVPLVDIDMKLNIKLRLIVALPREKGKPLLK